MIGRSYLMYTLEKATEQELEICWEIILEGRRFQQEQGFIQWTDDYPTFDMICEDIRTEKGYVLKVDGDVAAYMLLDFDGEPAYDKIDGRWNAVEPYAVIHRMAFSGKYRNRGLSGIAFALVEELCRKNGLRYLRCDTDEQNKRMQHVFKKNGFSYCGIIDYFGDGKLAFDKLLDR